MTGKVVLSNGTVHEFDQPLTVAELMLEHPQQVVVEFRSLIAGKRVTPLPADKKLDMKNVYLMIPMKIGRTGPLSVDEARQVLQNANNVLRSRALMSSTKLLPLLLGGCKMGITVESNVVVVKKEDIVEKLENNKTEILPINFEERTEFLSRQFSGKGWKPSLDTIKEKKIEKKVSHWLF
ncbi:multidrug resistance protein ABC transporter family protein [Thalictrum thalictroides]|uniref:Multidrug resistance protein ABC transporter family protein n=1 Tax=Thalictrum thalictroides TaxID=46969 RepID=A0A7J6UT98_THATH|nr:multidrug resistance protein ABC transporter family protein [Thalictrum thalictroides]